MLHRIFTTLPTRVAGRRLTSRLTSGERGAITLPTRRESPLGRLYVFRGVAYERGLRRADHGAAGPSDTRPVIKSPVLEPKFLGAAAQLPATSVDRTAGWGGLRAAAAATVPQTSQGITSTRRRTRAVRAKHGRRHRPPLSLFLHLRLLFFISVADIKDSAAAAPFQAAAAKSQIPEPEEKLRCPRCDSTNTKFCYYNNYNLFQPRHFCKSCRRYWTKGGALRNVPIGGGTRKRSKAAAASSSSASSSKSSSPPKPGRSPSGHAQPEPISVLLPPFDADHRLLDTSGSFISLLASSGRHFGGPSNSFLPGGGPSAGMRNPSNVSSSGVVGHEWELHNFTGSNVYESIAATLSTECLSFDLSVYNPGSNFL
ncbi:hypothetical protein B296_00015210 [Ensete ventricosum]|uniref:Dof zinc finger protein n=1 Tax=Ensete ventricosum TaxID=4639 RepID=A0A426ZWU4_ENSVE|nr:hypothetical protein B296_00015210 [Ensete ventricosum]